MKFAVYEVREDEKKMLNTLAERHHRELALTAGPLTPETLSLAEGAQGISTLGQSHMNREMFKAVAEMGIHAYHARCIGGNHVAGMSTLRPQRNSAFRFPTPAIPPTGSPTTPSC